MTAGCMTLTLWLHALPAPHRVPEPAAIGQEHVQVALHRVFVEGAVQPGPATAHVGGDVVQGAEALQLVLVEDLLHVEPEHRLCTESGQAVAHHQGWAMHWGNGLWAVLRIFFFFSFEDFKSYFLNTEKEDTREYAKHNNDPQSTI